MTKDKASLLAAHARDVIKQLSAKTCKMATAIKNWNEGVKQAGFDGVYDFPTQGYTRKAQIIADLERCAAQLDDYCEPNPYAPRTVEQQTREFNAALTRVLDADEAHVEALVINTRLEAAKKTVLGKVISGATKRAGSYGRFYIGCHVSHFNVDCAKSYGGALSTNDMKHGCYSVAAFNR
ncbi:hypothetical protein [Serratia fonticola]|uniref:hypothetical protein n=1 Tax=Serratia fonticola TaxID=47917 RepID=UPI0034C5CB46